MVRPLYAWYLLWNDLSLCVPVPRRWIGAVL